MLILSGERRERERGSGKREGGDKGMLVRIPAGVDREREKFPELLRATL